MKPYLFVLIGALVLTLSSVAYGEPGGNEPLLSLNANLTQQQLQALDNNVFLNQFLAYLFTGRYDGETVIDDSLDKLTLDDLIDIAILFFVGQVEGELEYEDGYDYFNPILTDLKDIQEILAVNGTTALTFARLKPYLTFKNARNLVLFYFFLNREIIQKRAVEYLSNEYLGGTSGNCKLHNMLWFDRFPKGEMWAIQLFDAVAKPPSGLFKGNINWLGSYQACKDVKNDLVSPRFRGKYCRSYISFPLDAVGDLNDLPIDDKIRFTYGLCVPDTCSESEVNSIVSNTLKLSTVFKFATANETECDEHYETSSWGMFYIILICIIVGWVLISTVYDCIASTIEHFKHSVVQDPPFVIENKQEIAGTGAVSPVKKVPPPKRSRFGQFMTNCSFYNNSIKFFRTDNGGKITCLNGIRFFSMFWIVFGHTFNYIADRYKFFLIDNVIWLQELNEQWYAQLIINGMFAVDTFFLMSAFLLSLGFMRKLEKSKALKTGEWIYYYVHRYWRLAPPFLLTIVIYVYVFPYLGQGPLFETGDFPPRAENCKKYWYSFVFMINNFVPTDSEEQCMGYLWYIPNDFQLYIISPIFIILLYKFPIAGMALLSSALAGSLTILAMLTSNVYVSRKKNIVFVLFDMWSDVYVKPYCRAAPWIVGIVLGYVFFKFKKVKLNYITVILGWTMSTAFALIALFGGYTNHGKDTRRMETAEYALYFSLSKLLWPLAIGWIIFACHYGYGGVINSFLSVKSFVPLNRLSYCAYLIHPMFMQLFNYSQETLFHGTGFTLVYAAAGNVFISLFAAYFFTLLFEWPFIALEKLVYSPSHE